jgi:hypothetical protein
MVTNLNTFCPARHDKMTLDHAWGIGVYGFTIFANHGYWQPCLAALFRQAAY